MKRTRVESTLISKTCSKLFKHSNLLYWQNRY